MMTTDELAAYFHEREHERDRATFHREQMAEARRILAELPPLATELQQTA